MQEGSNSIKLLSSNKTKTLVHSRRVLFQFSSTSGRHPNTDNFRSLNLGLGHDPMTEQ
jgi:hypothetical protein